MMTQRNESTPRNKQLRFEEIKQAALTKRLMPATQASAKNSVATNPTRKDFHKLEVLTLLSNSGVSRATRIATIAAIDDIDLLIDIATGDAPIFLKKNALLKIDELRDGWALEKNDLDRLVPCLNKKELVAFTITLMDMSDYDWCAHCDEGTVGVLCLALYECNGMHETVLLEDALAHLSHMRKDLAKVISASSPEKFFARTTCVPTDATHVMFVDIPQDNVA